MLHRAWLALTSLTLAVGCSPNFHDVGATYASFRAEASLSSGDRPADADVVVTLQTYKYLEDCLTDCRTENVPGTVELLADGVSVLREDHDGAIEVAFDGVPALFELILGGGLGAQRHELVVPEPPTIAVTPDPPGGAAFTVTWSPAGDSEVAVEIAGDFEEGSFTGFGYAALEDDGSQLVDEDDRVTEVRVTRRRELDGDNFLGITSVTRRLELP